MSNVTGHYVAGKWGTRKRSCPRSQVCAWNRLLAEGSWLCAGRTLSISHSKERASLLRLHLPWTECGPSQKMRAAPGHGVSWESKNSQRRNTLRRKSVGPLRRQEALKHGGGCSVAQSCLTLFNPVDCSTPGFTVLHCFPELAQIHVH